MHEVHTQMKIWFNNHLKVETVKMIIQRSEMKNTRLNKIIHFRRLIKNLKENPKNLSLLMEVAMAMERLTV